MNNLIDRQQARLQPIQASAPGRLSLPGSRRAWQNRQSQQQTRHNRLEDVREIKEGMGLHAPKIEKLATLKMRAENPELASDWDAMREAACRHQLQLRKHEGKQSQALKLTGRSLNLGLTARPK